MLYFTDSLTAEIHNDRIQEQRFKARSQSDSFLVNGHGGQTEPKPHETGAESVKMGLLFQARSLDERVNANSETCLSQTCQVIRTPA